MKERTKFLSILFISQLLIMLLGFTNIPVQASVNTNQQVSNSQIDNLINSIPKYLTQQQYEKFVNLTAGDLNISMSELFLGVNSNQNKSKNIGLWNVTDYQLLRYKQIPNSQMPTNFVHYQDYSNYNDIVTYYVSMSITAKQDNMDIFSGTNYFIWVFGKNNAGEYKLLQWSQPIIQEMVEHKLAYGDGTENLQRDIQNARKNGIVLNGKKENITGITPMTSYPPGSCPIKSQIRVYRVSLHRIDTVDFYSYVKNVLPNEWTASSDPMESLKTGAMCVKMYGWYHCYFYKYYGLGYDVVDTVDDQVYTPNTENSRSTSAINAVGGIGIENSAFSLFETQYLASGPTMYTGKVSQTGANTLANSGYDWLYICAYYYNFSDKSTGNIHYFNY